DAEPGDAVRKRLAAVEGRKAVALLRRRKGRLARRPLYFFLWSAAIYRRFCFFFSWHSEEKRKCWAGRHTLCEKKQNKSGDESPHSKRRFGVRPLERRFRLVFCAARPRKQNKSGDKSPHSKLRRQIHAHSPCFSENNRVALPVPDIPRVPGEDRPG